MTLIWKRTPLQHWRAMRSRQKLGLIAAVCALLIAGSGIALWINRISLITWGVVRALDNQGLGPVAFRIDSMGLNEFRARDVALRSGTIRAGEMNVTYSLFDLLAGHMRHVEISGFATQFAISDQGVTWNGMPLGKPASNSAKTDSSPINKIRIDELTFKDAAIRIETQSGVIEAIASATLTMAGGVISGAEIDTTIKGELGGTPQTLALKAQSFVIDLQKPDDISTTLTQASAVPGAYPWMAQGIDAKMNWTPEHASADFAVGHLENLQSPVLIMPVKLVGTASMQGTHIEFSANGETEKKADARFEAKGFFDRADSSGNVDLVLAPVQFRKGLQPSDLMPVIGNSAKDVEGSISLKGKLGWKAGVLQPHITLNLNKLSFATSSSNLRDVTGAITINRLSPLGTLPSQSISATIETPGIPTAALNMKGQLINGPALRVQSLVIGIAGGEITTTPFTVNTSLSSIATTLQVSNLDFAEVTKLLSIEGLSGTGHLDGNIPLALKNKEITIDKGSLKARDTGVIQYQPSKLPDEITKSDSSVDLAFKALSDFHYDTLVLDLDKQGSGEGTVMLRLQGQNPALLSGHAFNFNIRVESNFDRLADYVLLSIRSTQDLLNRAARRSEQ